MPAYNPSVILDQARDAVLEAGRIIRDNWQKPKDIKLKGRIDLVTETDVAVERALKNSLAAILPGSDFLAEETDSGTRPGKSTWIIDPVDGTTNFAHQLPFVATSVALWQEGRPVLGIINLPLLDECFYATLGAGAYLNGKSISVSDTDDLGKSLLATGFPYDIEDFVDEVVANLRAFLVRARGVRRAGAAALDLAYVACGRFDGFYESALKPWDTAAGWLLIQEAGGRVTTCSGDPFELNAPNILASNGRIHDHMSEIING